MQKRDEKIARNIEESFAKDYEPKRKLRVEERLRIRRALKNALESSLVPVEGCGYTEYDVDGPRLYDCIRGILDTI